MFSHSNNDGSYLFKSKCLSIKKGLTLIELVVYIAILLIFLSVFDMCYKGVKKLDEDKYKEEVKNEIHNLITYSTCACKNNKQDGRIIFDKDRVILKIGEDKKKEIDLRKGYTVSFNASSINNLMVINNNGKIYTAGTILINVPDKSRITMSTSVDSLYVRVKE
ncbi:prepilin-type N-terminal cleavage/methylation domain-containing protein [Clostridium manihotivorum]|uniref:Prepilin-type N-terminal cleavage/methylation domain-containing protein n=1 Tax=Clostridium manihotivorum TaxID=2320868 RepID=A0A3R5U8R5_9CLOT|nr:prepilin-type N-terminal cleavage/methylation domain-containing protein [Clostridium manihotivorum]QAA32049.1 hypothetical protein C1I91_10500 [Clostridium manihotivorum]